MLLLLVVVVVSFTPGMRKLAVEPPAARVTAPTPTLKSALGLTGVSLVHLLLVVVYVLLLYLLLLYPDLFEMNRGKGVGVGHLHTSLYQIRSGCQSSVQNLHWVSRALWSGEPCAYRGGPAARKRCGCGWVLVGSGGGGGGEPWHIG